MSTTAWEKTQQEFASARRNRSSATRTEARARLAAAKRHYPHDTAMHARFAAELARFRKEAEGSA
jgi:hypothetical protein